MTSTVQSAKPGNSASFVLGIIALVLAVSALLVCWIPFLGLVAIPIAAISIFLAFIGLLVAIEKGSGFALPLVGLLLSVPPIAVSLLLTAGATVVIGEASVAQKKLVESVVPLVLISDIQLTRDFFDGQEYVELGYTLTNTSSETITHLETRVSFMDESGAVIYEDADYPVSSGDPNMAPGQMTSVDPNMSTYQKVPANKVKSVDVAVVDVSLEN